jgi:hypothetical protein
MPTTHAAFLAAAKAARPHATAAFHEAIATLATCAHADHAAALAGDPLTSPLAYQTCEGEPVPTLAEAEAEACDPYELALAYLQAYA